MKAVKVPDADHPISIEPRAGRMRVLAGGSVIADSRGALALRESGHSVVHYIPRSDVNMALLVRTEETTYCPYKGHASYYSIASAGERGTNAVWTYEEPYEAVAAIKDHLAFYPDQVDAIELTVESSPACGNS